MWAYCVDAVGRYIGPITVSVHFVRKGWTLANRSIMIMCCSNSILGTIMQFSTEWCSLHIEKSKIFAVSALMFIVEDAYILRNLPWLYLGQVWFWARSSNFIQIYAPWTKNKIQFSEVLVHFLCKYFNY